MSFFHQGRIVAAIAVPKKVTAMTSDASRVSFEKPVTNEYRYETITPGTMMSSNAYHGTPRSETRPAHSGRTRSNAAAKIIRVDDSQRVPAQPRNHTPKMITMSIWMMRLSIKKAASIGG